MDSDPMDLDPLDLAAEFCFCSAGFVLDFAAIDSSYECASQADTDPWKQKHKSIAIIAQVTRIGLVSIAYSNRHHLISALRA